MSSETPVTRDIFIHQKARTSNVWEGLKVPIRTSAPSLNRIKRHSNADRLLAESELRIRSIIDNRLLETYYQSIVDLRTGRSLGVEALSRFTHELVRTPDLWFDEATSVGLGTELEVIALERAVAGIDRLPADMYMAINASAEAIQSDEFHMSLADVDVERIVLEVVGQTATTDYRTLAASIADLRSRGLRVAVDDVGAGPAGLAHLTDLKPDIIKLNAELTRGIDRDPGRQALGLALLQSGLNAHRSTVVAEGIETKEELATLRSLGFPVGQGYVLGRPGRGINRASEPPFLPARRVPELTDWVALPEREDTPTVKAQNRSSDEAHALSLELFPSVP